jgi:hypothetical protein
LAAITFIVALGVFRLPETFIIQLEDNRPLEPDAAKWAFWMIFGVAILQALYCGFITLRAEKVAHALETDPRYWERELPDQTAVAAKVAVGLGLLTLVYGLAALFLTGARAGFWLFVVLIVAQSAWYFRQVGQVAHVLAQRPPPLPEPEEWEKPVRTPVTYSPPLARAFSSDLDPPEDAAGHE